MSATVRSRSSSTTGTANVASPPLAWPGTTPREALSYDPGPRALDLRSLGTRRLQLGRMGRPGDRVHVRRWARTRQLDRCGRDGGGLSWLVEGVGGLPRPGRRAPPTRRRARVRAHTQQRAWQDERTGDRADADKGTSQP